MNRFLYYLLFTFYFLLFASVAQAFEFTRNLSLGSEGVDVLELQKVLNKDPRTAVSISGPGSFGQETFYFGSKTRSAVILFQNLYAREILYPADLSYGTGFVGNLTRAKLNSFQSTSTTNLSIPPISSTGTGSPQPFILAPSTPPPPAFPNNFSSKFYITAISAMGGEPGDKIIVSGQGFTREGNEIRIGHTKIGSFPSQGQIVTFEIPDIKPGPYAIHIKNSNGTSTYPFFLIKKPGSRHSELTKISPSGTLDSETKITLYGKGFAAENDIYTNLGTIEDVSPTNDKLEFYLSDAPALKNRKATTTINSIQSVIFITNEYGISNALGPILLSF